MRKLIIEKDKLEKNVRIVTEMARSKIIAVSKGNGYGFGLIEFAGFLHSMGINYFAVFDPDEAILLRQSFKTVDILLLSSISIKKIIIDLIQNDITLTAGSFDSLSTIAVASNEIGKTSKIHIKLDTGFGRFGFCPDEINEMIGMVNKYLSAGLIDIKGTFTHFSASFVNNSTTQTQFKLFLSCVEYLKTHGLECGLLHVANSCAFLRFPQMHLDAVRLGSVFTGRIPIENIYALEKVGYLESKIIEEKNLPCGHNVGYANAYKTKSKVRTGIIPVGYRHGFGLEKACDTFRARDIFRNTFNCITSLNQKLYLHVAGEKCRILGRIGLCNIVVDITKSKVGTGDTVTIPINPLLVDSSVIREWR